MRQWIARKAVLRGQRIAYIEELRALEWAGEDQILAYHQAALDKVLKDAVANVPYYRDHAKGDKLEDFPILTRQIIKDFKEELTVKDRVNDKTRKYQTSGTTSQPMTFLQDPEHIEYGVALNLFFYEWAGMKPGDPFVKIWSNIRAKTAYARFRNSLSGWVRNTHVFDTFDLRAEVFDQHKETIERIQPKVILTYALAIYEFARHLERTGQTIKFDGAIMSSVSTMTPHMRETVARVFKCPVFDRYGSREMMDMACDCECHEGLHVNPVLQHIEILDEDDQPCPPGKLGRIIVTQLHNPVMPLIRYDTRDYAAWAEKPCSCGRNWPMIKQIDGRGISMFRFRNGGVITSFFLIYHIMKLFGEDHVRRSQIIQKDYNHYHIKLMLYNKEKWPDLEDERAAIKRVLADHIEEEARITYEILDEIPRTPSGKHLQAICEIDEEKDS